MSTAVAGVATRDCGLLVIVGALIGGYVLGQVAVWAISWVVFALRATLETLTAARSEIKERGSRLGDLATERDEVRKKLDDALEKAAEAERPISANYNAVASGHVLLPTEDYRRLLKESEKSSED